MSRHSEETIGVRYTGWAALDRDPQEDTVEFTDGFLQDLQGEMASCRNCRKALHIAPVVLLHDQDEKRRFQAVFATDAASLN